MRSKNDDRVVGGLAKVERVCWICEKENEVSETYSAYMNKAIASSLRKMEQSENGGRGVSCVRTIANYLERDMFDDAQNVAYNDFDKIRSYPDIMTLIVNTFPKVKEAYSVEVGGRDE